MKIAIGPLVSEFGGVSQHILGISRHSRNRVEEVPSRFTRRFIRGEQDLLVSLYARAYGASNFVKLSDLAHSHGWSWFTDLCSRKMSRRWVQTYHMLYFADDYDGVLNPIRKKANTSLATIAGKAPRKICVSNWLRDFIAEEFSLEAEVIPNAFDMDKRDRADASRFVSKYGVRDFILYNGNIDKRKNPGQFIELVSRMPEHTFLMYGRNITPDFVRAYKNPIPKNLWLLGELSDDDSMDAMAASKAFVMTSQREGLPTALMEAMGMGKPVVASNVFGCNEVVEDNVDGFLYDIGSIEDLVEKVSKALESRSIGERARESALSKFDWKVVAPRIDAVYESFL